MKTFLVLAFLLGSLLAGLVHLADRSDLPSGFEPLPEPSASHTLIP